MSLTPLIHDDWMDSYLMPGGTAAIAELTLIVKVYLARHPATTQSYRSEDGQQVSVQSIDWDSESGHQWAVDMKNAVEDGWNDKLWLVPDTDWRFDSPPGRDPTFYQVPCIACKLQVVYAPRADAHVVINSYRLNPDDFFRSSMSAPFSPTARRCSLRGGETTGTMDTNDVKPKRSGQIAAVHEFGHFIGLSHVNARAAAISGEGPNSRLAYGEGDQARDMMGSGTQIAGWHAYPWCRRLRRHLGGSQPSSTSWHYVRGATPCWLTGSGIDAVYWQVSTRRRTHVTINNLDLYRRRTDWGVSARASFRMPGPERGRIT